MRKMKTVVAIGIVSLFLLGAILPITSTATVQERVATEAASTGEHGKLKCYVFRSFQYVATNEVEVNEEMIDDLQYIKDRLEIAKNELKNGDINDAEQGVRDAIEKMREVNILPNGVSTEEILDIMFGNNNRIQPSGIIKYGILQPIMSVGIGKMWIPFYPGEAFFGVMLRPMLFGYLAGFTASFNIHLAPPRIDYWDMLGPHLFMTFGFAGIYIDLAGVSIPGIPFPFTQLALGETGAIIGIGI